ncbi:putative transcription factor WD40-like family [Helianthus annuus]|nr:putative transcription factor WD40-like family [Helianthus annuus]
MSHLQTSDSHDDLQGQYCNYHLPITHHCVSTIKGDNSYISSLALGGKFLYTGSSNKKIRMMKRDTLRAEFDQEKLSDYTIVTGNGAVKSLVVSADKIFSAHQDHKIRVWRVDENEMQQPKLTPLATLPTFSDRTLNVLLPKNHVHVSRHKRSTWVHHNDTVSALAMSRDGLVVYSVSWDRTLKIWNANNFKCLESVCNAHDDAINAVVVSSNGDVYTGSTDKTIKIWRKSESPKGEKHSLITTLKKHKLGINALAFSTNENVLYSGGSDRLIIAWEKIDEDDMAAVAVIKGHVKSILCLSVVSDLLCSGSADETVRIWKGIEKCYCCLAVLEGHSGPVKCLTSETDHAGCSCDTSTSYLIYSGGLDYDIKVWQICIAL